MYEETRKVLEQCDLEAGLQLFISQHQTGTDRPGKDSEDQVQVVLAGAVRPGDWAPALYIPAPDRHRQARYRQYRPGTGCTDRPGIDSTDQVQVARTGQVQTVQTRYRLHGQARYRQYRPGTGCTDRPGTDSTDQVQAVKTGQV